METKNHNSNSNTDDIYNDYENKAFVQNVIKNNKNIFNKQINNKKIIINLILIISFLFIIFILFLNVSFKNKQEKKIMINNLKNNTTLIEEIPKEKNNRKQNLTKFKSFYSDKWVVLTTIRPPNRYIQKLLLKIPEPWKFVVIGDIKTNNKSWDIYKNSTRLKYLSIEEQMKLGYNITKYIPFNSYSRKNIGYLYAIQHGAKEIFETDDNILFFRKSFLDQYVDKYTFYAENNDSLMINPYSFFGKPSMWPRGFRYKDIEKNVDQKFYRMIGNRTKLNHLIFQGILNMEPDVDSIYRQTRVNKNNYYTNQIFYFISNIMYLPGNFVPINSKCTRYLYDVFPSLPLPTTVSKRVSDIWRGYLMQRYAWIYNGTLVYSQPIGDNKRKYHNLTKDFIEERDLFFKLDNLLNALNVDIDPQITNPSDFLIDLVELLVHERILGEDDLKLYRAFMDDLESFGYTYNLKFDKTIERDHKKFLNTYSEFNYFFQRQNKIVLQNNNNKNIKLFKHRDSKEKYDDILLIINYNYDFLTKLNNYILSLYHEYFPHIIFMYPGNIENNETYVSCPESHYGYYSYVCIKRVYELYPNKRGYLFLMDDDFLKVWELENLDFNIPWFYHFFIRFGRFHDPTYIKTKKILDIYPEWKKRYRYFVGSTIVAYAVSDIYYIPKEDILNFCNKVDVMYERRIFLETAVPTIMGIMLKERYQIILFAGLWRERRNYVINYLRNSEKQLTIHPIKFSNLTYQDVVNKYIYIINARDY